MTLAKKAFIVPLTKQATFKTWTRTLDSNPKKPSPRKTWTQENLNAQKHGINIGLENMSDFSIL